MAADAEAVDRDLDIRLTLVAVIAEGGYLIRSGRHARFVPFGASSAEDMRQFRALHPAGGDGELKIL